MQIKLYFKGLHQEIKLPASYQYIIQSTIYQWLSDNSDWGTYLHDHGRSYEERHFKYFTFSALQGRYQLAERSLIFQDEIILQIRSIDEETTTVLSRALSRRESFILAAQECRICKVEVSDEKVKSSPLLLRMLSPVTVYRTDFVTGKTHYFTPWEEEFYARIIQNFYRKFKAYYEEFPQEAIELKPYKVSGRDKVVTRYKGIYITGWKGIYEISGPAAYLDFLYHVGLGAKNAQGFGMFEIWNPKS